MKINYAFLDIAHQFQLEVMNQFLSKTDSSLGYMLTSIPGTFHGDNKVCEHKLSQLKKDYPSSIHKTVQDFLYLDSMTEMINVPWGISENFLLENKQIESMAMRLMDRSALIPISTFSRRRIYLVLINYFNFIIDSQEIDAVVVFDTPHSYSSHIFYELCRVKGLKVIKMEYHFLTDYSIMTNSHEWPEIPKEFHRDLTFAEIEKTIPVDLAKDVFKNSEYLKKYKTSESKSVIRQNAFSSFKLILRYIDKVVKNTIMGVFPFLFKKEILHFASLNGIKNRFYYRMILNVQLYKLIGLNIHYNKIANSNLSLKIPYVFVGLHMQPEKTSQPMGGEFDNQLAMIKTLADSIPEGWKVYVKEHPNQFNVKKVPNRHYRDKIFYSMLQSMDNVELVPLEVDSNDLIENAKFVATLTGTLGWEAITRNVPALVFGYTYYMSCRAVRKVSSVEDCKQAIADIGVLTEDDFKKEIIRYISYYYENKYLLKSANWTSLFDLSSISYEEQTANIVERIIHFHDKNNKLTDGSS